MQSSICSPGFQVNWYRINKSEIIHTGMPFPLILMLLPSYQEELSGQKVILAATLRSQHMRTEVATLYAHTIALTQASHIPV